MKTPLATLLILASTLAAVAAQTPTPSPTPTPVPAPTPASILAPAVAGALPPNLASVQAAKRVLVARQVQQLARTLIGQFNAIFSSLWAPSETYTDAGGNVQSLTPAQAWGSLGRAGGSLLQMAAGFAPAINAVSPGAVPLSGPPGYTAAINADGTVTITYTVPAATPTPTPTAAPSPAH